MISTNIICPMCESAELIPKKGTEHYCYKGHKLLLDNMEYSECPICFEEVITPEQIKRGEVRIRAEHRKIDEYCAESKHQQRVRLF